MERAADIAIVGGGVSCVALLGDLAARAAVEPDRLPRPLRVLALDGAGEFGGGVAYGRSVPEWCLCNDPAGVQHPNVLVGWLEARRDDWLGRLAASGTPAVARWLAQNAAALESARSDPSAYDGLFVPRAVYGDFLRERLEASLARVGASGLVEVDLRTERATGIERDPRGFRLRLGSGGRVAAGSVVLAVGSPPPRPAPELVGRPGYVRAPSADDVGRLGAALAAAPWRAAVVILGGNACASEVLQLIDATPDLRRRVARVTCVTRGGRLPDAAASGAGVPALPRLAALEAGTSPTADALFAAALVDIREASDRGFTPPDYADALHARVVPLLAGMDSGERRGFVERYGRAYKGLARHTPPEYRLAAANLASDGILSVVRGEVGAVRVASGGFRVPYRDGAGTQRELEAAVVLDCRGWGHLDEATDPFLAGLLAPDAGLARANGSRIGLAVDEDLQASPGLFVMGPLLAGCSNARHTIWNLENARRIFALAPVLAASLLRQVAAAR